MNLCALDNNMFFTNIYTFKVISVSNLKSKHIEVISLLAGQGNRA